MNPAVSLIGISNRGATSISPRTPPKLLTTSSGRLLVVKSSTDDHDINNNVPLRRPQYNISPELAQHHLLSALIEANSIYSYYIDIGAPNDLNLSPALRRQTRAALDTILIRAITANNMHLPSRGGVSSPPPAALSPTGPPVRDSVLSPTLPLPFRSSVASPMTAGPSPSPRATDVISPNHIGDDAVILRASPLPQRGTVDDLNIGVAVSPPKLITRKGVSVSSRLTVEECLSLECEVRTVFDACQGVVVALLDLNCFQRFLASDVFRNLLENLRGVTTNPRDALMVGQAVPLGASPASSAKKGRTIAYEVAATGAIGGVLVIAGGIDDHRNNDNDNTNNDHVGGILIASGGGPVVNNDNQILAVPRRQPQLLAMDTNDAHHDMMSVSSSVAGGRGSPLAFGPASVNQTPSFAYRGAINHTNNNGSGNNGGLGGHNGDNGPLSSPTFTPVSVPPLVGLGFARHQSIMSDLPQQPSSQHHHHQSSVMLSTSTTTSTVVNELGFGGTSHILTTSLPQTSPTHSSTRLPLTGAAATAALLITHPINVTTTNTNDTNTNRWLSPRSSSPTITPTAIPSSNHRPSLPPLVDAPPLSSSSIPPLSPSQGSLELSVFGRMARSGSVHRASSEPTSPK
jgi:hypothetical protein